MDIYAGLIQIALNSFQDKGEPALRTICNCKVVSYAILLKYKSLERIEDMPDKDKKDLKAYIIQMFPEKTIQEKVNAAKIVYTIGNLIWWKWNHAPAKIA